MWLCGQKIIVSRIAIVVERENKWDSLSIERSRKTVWLSTHWQPEREREKARRTHTIYCSFKRSIKCRSSRRPQLPSLKSKWSWSMRWFVHARVTCPIPSVSSSTFIPSPSYYMLTNSNQKCEEERYFSSSSRIRITSISNKMKLRLTMCGWKFGIIGMRNLDTSAAAAAVSERKM